jgi:hypothetical protein
MMGERTVAQDASFYSFNLERHVPAEHMQRSIDRFVDLPPPRAPALGQVNVDTDLRNSDCKARSF